jgi:hypothetical protein
MFISIESNILAWEKKSMSPSLCLRKQHADNFYCQPGYRPRQEGVRVPSLIDGMGYLRLNLVDGGL